MTMTPTLASYLRTLPNRCQTCLWAPRTQGHAPDCTEGVRRGREAMAQAVGNHPADAARVDAVLDTFICSGGEFSLNDMRGHLTQVKARNVIGARIGAAIRAKRIKEVGRVRSTDPSTHGHKIGVYRST